MQTEIDVAEYILNSKEYFDSLPLLVQNLIIPSPQINQYPEEFIRQYQDLLLTTIKLNVANSFISLNCEDLNVIITKDLVVKLLGMDYFKYEYSN